MVSLFQAWLVVRYQQQPRRVSTYLLLEQISSIRLSLVVFFSYYVNDDIIIELLFSKENTVNVRKVFIGEKEYKYNLFLKDKDKILLYIETFSKINNQDLIIELEVKGEPLILKKKD